MSDAHGNSDASGPGVSPGRPDFFEELARDAKRVRGFLGSLGWTRRRQIDALHIALAFLKAGGR